jgi:hypothetical protein
LPAAPANVTLSPQTRGNRYSLPHQVPMLKGEVSDRRALAWAVARGDPVERKGIIMWCHHCQQDVPGVNGSQPGAVRCVRCGTNMALDGGARAGLRQDLDYTADHGVNLEEGLRPVEKGPDIDFENWDLEREIRKLRGLSAGESLLSKAKSVTIIHQAHARATEESSQEMAISGRNRSESGTRETFAPSNGQFGFWVLMGSIAAIICGGGLMIAGNADTNSMLGIYGVPLLGYGQIGLLLGLILQLDRINYASRSAAARIADMQSQLAQVEKTTSELSATRGSLSQTFYSHMVDGASPQILLADLKGQLDLLATKLSR